MPRIIAFTGAMGSGKSTCIELLSKMQVDPGYKTHIQNIKLAQPLYDIQEMVYDRIKDVYKRPKDFVKDRKLLQFLGTEWGREAISSTLWTDLWKKEVLFLLENASWITITCDDLRYDNEAEMIKSLGGIIIKIESSSSNSRINTNNGISGHKSELGIDLKYVDHVLVNDGSIDELRKSLSDAIAKSR